MKLWFLLSVGCCAVLSASLATLADQPFQMVPATPPAQAAATIQLQDGFRAELIAAEPLLCSPVDIAYDENGLAYVVEMIDYPYTDVADDKPWEDQKSKPIGRVRVLEDLDGDGIYDKSEVFAEGLSWPSGIACWQGGVYVAATPDFLYLKDTDGDRKADVRRAVFQGFRKYNVQAVMNSLRWGLDNRIYVAGSSNGGTITDRDNEKTVLSRSDFCFDPNDEKLELVAGGARFGNTVDDWGNRFLCNIRNPVQHVLFPSRYLKRNRYLALPSSLHDVAPSGDAIPVYRVSPPEPWRVIHAERMANSAHREMFDSTRATGYVTSSSGLTIYRGAAYPPEYSGNAFVGEVAGNLVIRYRLDPSGASFRSERPYVEADFLASTDNWFRPVNFANAPDGTLHVLDMYRQTIEHPWSLPDDLQARLDLTEGRDRGRIYRILPPQFPEGFTPPPPPRLGNATTEQLVNHLADPNGWWRDTAQRLLFERQDPAAIPLLRQLLRDRERLPVARLHALWVLQGQKELNRDDLLIALSDPESRVQANAVRLSESYLAEDNAIRQEVMKLASADDSQLRFQVALSLGEAPSSEVTATLASALRRDGQDPWMRGAVMSSLGGQERTLLLDLLADAEYALSELGSSIALDLIGPVASVGKEEGALEIADRLADPSFDSEGGKAFRRTMLLRLGSGLKRQGIVLTKLANRETAGSGLVAKFLDDAQKTASNSTAEAASRIEAMPWLEFIDFASAYSILAPLIDPRLPTELQTQAINTLTTFPNDQVAEHLLARYRSLTPVQQQQVVDRLMGRSNWLMRLFDAIEAGTVATSRVPSVRQEGYTKSTNAQVRSRAEKLFKKEASGERGEIVEKYIQEVSKMMQDADVQRGLIVYEKNCANCHQSGGRGYEVGPHLSTVKSRGDGELIVSILDPNREVSPNYLTYMVATVEGLVYSGVVVSETGTNITMRGVDKNEVTIPRDEIEEFQSSGQSLMPIGLEKTITPREMADLLAFIKGQ